MAYAACMKFMLFLHEATVRGEQNEDTKQP